MGLQSFAGYLGYLGRTAEKALYVKSLISVFQEIFTNISKRFNVARRLGTGLSFCGVWGGGHGIAQLMMVVVMVEMGVDSRG